MEALFRDYAPKGVRFFYVYKSLAHPSLSGYVAPFTLQERLLHVKEAGRVLRSKITWLCDTMLNDLEHALGDASSSEFLIDPEDRIAGRRAWNDPDALRRDLAKLLEAVERPMSPSEVDVDIVAPTTKVATEPSSASRSRPDCARWRSSPGWRAPSTSCS